MASSYVYAYTQVVAPAGSLVIFTEALLHGTLPWTAAHEPGMLTADPIGYQPTSCWICMESDGSYPPSAPLAERESSPQARAPLHALQVRPRARYSRGRVCHYVPIAVESAQRYIRS